MISNAAGVTEPGKILFGAMKILCAPNAKSRGKNSCRGELKPATAEKVFIAPITSLNKTNSL